MKNLWICISLALLLSPFYASEYEYMTWRADAGVQIYGKSPRCIDIPEDLRLCFNVGYDKMMLPNLLEHDTVAEVKQQAGSWVPLVHKACHPGTQVLLCSLFAPVCLEKPLYPCRWLCEAVRDSCAPLMQAYGFPWPEMLNCDKFPQDDVLPCIAMNETTSHSMAGPAVIKTKIKEVKIENLDRKLILQNKKKQFKLVTLKKQDLKKLVIYLKNGADCPCQQLDNLGKNFLIMGRFVGQQYILTGIHKWDKSSKEFKKTLKKLKSLKCATHETVFK
ncbi:Secreted frizzled-related protein 1 [Triplophysa tibetana]|uniref:Secreted frizzled-related protein 1 n=1 Tax=Triplophysa tibetana TaxID=1572043 RepID=A0A5A9N4C9_9TELE|nr:Secreted frizzled-related protein 1 [Triplophysa tibetana]